MSHRLDIPLDLIEDALSGQFAAAHRLMKPGVNYRRSYSLSSGLLTVTWEEVPKPGRKEAPTLVSSKW